MAGYASTTDMLQATSLPISTGLGGALGAIVDDGFATDEEMTQPNETPRDPSGWEALLAKGLEAIPTIVTNTAQGYSAYSAAGGGSQGLSAAVIDVFGNKQQTSQQQVNAALVAAAKQQAAATAAPPWYKRPEILIPIIGGGGLIAWLLSRR